MLFEDPNLVVLRNEHDAIESHQPPPCKKIKSDKNWEKEKSNFESRNKSWREKLQNLNV